MRLFSREEWLGEANRLGPEPLDPGLTTDALFGALRRSRSPIRSWLLDQTHIAGIGNIYASEALFRAGIHPKRPARSLGRGESGDLLTSVRNVLNEAIRARGTTLRDYRTASGDRGGFGPSLQAYGREGDPCSRCNTPIDRIVFGNRSAFFCPEVPRESMRVLFPPPDYHLFGPSSSPKAGGSQETFDGALVVQEHTLANGLRLFILPRPGIPIASFVVQYRIGSVNEGPGNTGIAHFLEHLLFKGTTSVGNPGLRNARSVSPGADGPSLRFHSGIGGAANPDTTSHNEPGRPNSRTWKRRLRQFVTSNEFDRSFPRTVPGTSNATTTSESTTYFVELPSNRAELWFVLEADRMQNPVFREFFTERDVVAEERRLRLENNPGGLLYQAHSGRGLPTPPLRHAPSSGTWRTSNRFTRAKVDSYFRSFYGPNNAVVAIAGDVDPDQILHGPESISNPFPRGTSHHRWTPWNRSNGRSGAWRWSIDAEPCPEDRMEGSTRSRSDDAPALYMLTSILTGGRSSRLYRRLVLEDRLASGVFSSIEPGQLYPGLFTIQASPNHPHTTEEVE